MENKTEKQLYSLVREYLSVPNDIQRIANIATMDLHFGPYTSENLEPEELELYPNFGTAIDKLRTWANNLPSTLYVDLDCDCDHVSESEAEGYQDEETGEYVEPYLENTWVLERSEILRALFNRELVSYL